MFQKLKQKSNHFSKRVRSAVYLKPAAVIALIALGQCAIIMAFRQQQAKVLLHASNQVLAAKGSTSQAEALAKRAVELNPYDGYAWFYYGTALYVQQQFSEASKAFTKGISVLPHSYNALRLLAFADYHMGNYESAAPQLKEYLTIVPSPPVTPELVFRMAGLAFLRLGKLADSNYYLLHATQLSEQKGDLFRARATVSLLSNQLWSADYCFRAFRFYMPGEEFHPFELVSNAKKADKLPITIDFLESVHARNPEDISLVKALASAYKSIGNHKKAGATLAEAIKRSPDNSDLHLMYADILFSEKKLAEAFKHYDEHLRLKPDSPYRQAILQRKAISRY